MIFAVVAKLFVGAVIGAGIGAAVSAATGGDVGQGAITGAISGAIFSGIGSWGLSGFPQAMAHAWGGMVAGAINAAVTGGDPGKNMIISGLSAGIASGIGSLIPEFSGEGLGAYLGNAARRAAIGAAVGGGAAEATGGDFGYGARLGAISAGVAYTANEMHLKLIGLAKKALSVFKFGKKVGPGADRTQAYYYQKAIKDTSRGLWNEYLTFSRNENILVNPWEFSIKQIRIHNRQVWKWLQPESVTTDIYGIEKLEAFDTYENYIMHDPDKIGNKPLDWVKDAFKIVY